MNFLWFSGILKRRTARVAGVFAGITLTVALLATLALFLVDSGTSMTRRAVADVPIDWQVETVPAADAEAISAAIRKAASVKVMHQVHYAQASGFAAVTADTTQVTGPGKAIAFDTNYLRDFPKEVRALAGKSDGVLIAQQTAANLHVGPGDPVTINRIGLPPVNVTIDGVVDLPDADALFQGLGLPSQAAPQAPPDNVLILPLAQWHRIFDPQQLTRPDTIRMQFHVGLVHDTLPTNPTDAYLTVEGQSRNLEAQVAGQALVSNNLGSRLDAVRGDALYATVLFLFLGIPGIALAIALTASIAASGNALRAQEQTLLRVRGTSTSRIATLASLESLFAGVFGTIVGLVLALAFGRIGGMLDDMRLASLGPVMIAAATGGLVVVIAVIAPVLKATRTATVARSRRVVGRNDVPLWQRLWLDFVFLAIAGLLFWQLESTGYEVVLAPEGVPAASVDYKAFLSPAFFWFGSALLTMRLSRSFLVGRNSVLRWVLYPVAGKLSGIVAASLAFQARRLTLGVTMTAIAISFVTSTAIFNMTYNGQTKVDAELTNGADVTVFGTTAHPASEKLALLQKLPGLAAAQPMQHRFAYVGADLQDMYGIDPKTIGAATSLSDAYFSGGTAREVMDRLAVTPDGVLVSEETVSDFQLQQGDTINLRLVSATDNQYHAVPFKFIGVAREFPTAPRDSFLVANAAYISKMSNSNVSEYILMRSAIDPAQLAKQALAALGPAPGVSVKDIGTASHIIGSSLTAVDLGKLTAIELSFGAIMAVAAAGLMLALGFLDRRRNFAILAAIGAKPPQLAAFLWSEGLLVVLGGIVFGVLSGTVTAWMLIKLLTGVFDPPPESMSVPWFYLGFVHAMVVMSVAIAVIVTAAISRTEPEKTLRDL
ncbi:MAG: transporter integral rane protein [Rhizobium sp.]|nr:transporter integral rane protein [Rhizobium sp.]